MGSKMKGDGEPEDAEFEDGSQDITDRAAVDASRSSAGVCNDHDSAYTSAAFHTAHMRL
jgi:hypothetical protein